MNTYIFVDPKFRPLSLAGIRMPNAYLQFFLSETSTPTPVYGAVPPASSLGVEVVSDAAGVFPVMYMDPNITYRVKLFDEDDVMQWDVDPYTPPRDYAPGTILSFFGTSVARDAAYPTAEWQVCDGSNGSPDMRDRFPIGVSSTKTIGLTGGSGAGSINTGSSGAHDHDGVVSETILSAADMPVHNHRLYVRTSSTLRGNTRGFGFANTAGVEGQIIDDAPYGYLDVAPQSAGNKLIEDTGTVTPVGHDHDIVSDGAHTHTVAVDEPPWLALWFLMRR